MKYFTSFRPEQHDYEYAERAIKAGMDGFEVVYRAAYLTPEVQSGYVDLLRRIKTSLGASFTLHAPAIEIGRAHV